MTLRLLTNLALLLSIATETVASAEPLNGTARVLTSANANRQNDSSSRTPDDGKQTSRPVEPRHPRVLFITANNCEKCDFELNRLGQAKGVFESLRSAGWKIGTTADNHIQIVDRTDVPELADLLKSRELPSVVAVENDEVLRYFKHGCTTPLDAWTFGWLLKGENERPKALISEPVEVETTGHYPLRGNHWSVEGDFSPSRATLLAHLRSPNHVSQMKSEWIIEDWSLEELRSLHDDLHEREGGGFQSGSAGQIPAARQGLGQFSGGRKF